MSDIRHDDAPVGTGKKGTAEEARALFGDAAGSQTIGRAVTINRPVAEVWDYYRDLSTAPTYMDGVVSVDTADPKRPHWVAHGTGHGTVEWDAEITEDRPHQVLAWKAVGTNHANSGRATFEEVAGRGTVVTLTLSWDPVGGSIGQLIAKFRQTDPAILARRNLRRLKQLLETGEIATAARNADLHAKGKTHE